MPEPSLGEIGRAEALSRMLRGVRVLGAEMVDLENALGRALAEPLDALLDQPPFDAASMDGYAVPEGPGLGPFQIVGESAAGRPFAGVLKDNEAVRIFTGAETPHGRRVVVQERAVRKGAEVVFEPGDDGVRNVRPRGGDFARGQLVLAAGLRLDPWRVGLAAAAGHGAILAVRRPRVAVLCTGEELLKPGARPQPGRIFDSAGPALRALIAAEGAVPVVLDPVSDAEADIQAAVEGVGADLIVTVGGASVGDHDLVKPALRRLGLALSVETVRLRPGKPTWFGRLGDERAVLGLPGNPASALVCAALFLLPLLRAMRGAPPEPVFETHPCAVALPPNGGREHFMRAGITVGDDGPRLVPFPDQDSSLVAVFAAAEALLVRPIGAPAAPAGALHPMLRLRRL